MAEQQQHPITPPEELVQQWMAEPEYRSNLKGACMMISLTEIRFNEILAKVAQWASNQREPEIQAAADAELEACVRHLDFRGHHSTVLDDLRAARRPKPLSAIEQAQALIERHEDGWIPSPAQWHLIREGLAEGRKALAFIPGENTLETLPE